MSKTIKAYRAGKPVAPDTHFEDLDHMITAMDSFAPEDRQTRRGAIFASPTILDHRRWLSPLRSRDSYEINVIPDNVMVYSVVAYEEASDAYYDLKVTKFFHQEEEDWAGAIEKFEDAIRSYWDSGVLLAQWEVFSEGRADAGDGNWEILLPASSISSSQKLRDSIIQNRITKALAE